MPVSVWSLWRYSPGYPYSRTHTHCYVSTYTTCCHHRHNMSHIRHHRYLVLRIRCISRETTVEYLCICCVCMLVLMYDVQAASHNAGDSDYNTCCVVEAVLACSWYYCNIDDVCCMLYMTGSLLSCLLSWRLLQIDATMYVIHTLMNVTTKIVTMMQLFMQTSSNKLATVILMLYRLC